MFTNMRSLNLSSRPLNCLEHHQLRWWYCIGTASSSFSAFYRIRLDEFPNSTQTQVPIHRSTSLHSRITATRASDKPVQELNRKISLQEMTTKSPPSALEPYLRLPPETSLILLTSTLGCSINWLTARFIGSALQNFSSSSTTGLEGQQTVDGKQDVAVLLVSWLRDLKFWQDEVRRVAVSENVFI